VAGLVANIDPPATGNTFKIGIWDGAGTMIQDATFDTDILNAVTAKTGIFYFDETSLTALTCGTKYYIGVEATGTGVILSGIQLADAADLSCFGETTFFRSAWAGSSWADDTTVRPLIGLLLADITEPGGSVGGGLLTGSGRLVY